jgi:hypothetical protein
VASKTDNRGAIVRTIDNEAVAQLIDARTGLHLGSEPFESGRTDLLGLQQDLAHAVAGTLRATLAVDPEYPGRTAALPRSRSSRAAMPTHCGRSSGWRCPASPPV